MVQHPSSLRILLLGFVSSSLCNAFAVVAVSSSSSSRIPSKMSQTTTKSTTTTREDTLDFHHYAAAAVDLSNAHVSSESSLLSGMYK
jgi:hypothetical protein